MNDGAIEEVLLVVLSFSIVLSSVHGFTQYILDATKPLQHQCDFFRKILIIFAIY